MSLLLSTCGPNAMTVSVFHISAKSVRGLPKAGLNTFNTKNSIGISPREFANT